VAVHAFIRNEVHLAALWDRRVNDVVVGRINGEQLSGLNALLGKTGVAGQEIFLTLSVSEFFAGSSTPARVFLESKVSPT